MRKTIILLTLSSLLLFSKTLVTVNGHKITDNLLAGKLEQLDPTQKSKILEQLIKEEVLYADLLKTPLVQSAEFQEAFNKQKSLVESQYGKQLNAEQLRNIKGAIALALFQQKEFDRVQVSENEIRNFYDQNPQLFNFPNSIEIANIIVQTKTEADQILNSLKGAPNLEQAFLDAAHAHQQSGYMGWFGRDNMPTNLFDIAYQQPVKTLLNTPVQTKHGYNVVYLLNKKVAGTLSYNEAKKKIEILLKQKKVMQKVQDKVDRLYGNAEIIY